MRAEWLRWLGRISGPRSTDHCQVGGKDRPSGRGWLEADEEGEPGAIHDLEPTHRWALQMGEPCAMYRRSAREGADMDAEIGWFTTDVGHAAVTMGT